MAQELGLWCGMGGFYTYPLPSQEQSILAFVDRCTSVGITHLFPTMVSDDYFMRFINFDSQDYQRGGPQVTLRDFYRDWHPLRILVEVAHQYKIEVHPYISINYDGGQWLKKDDSLMGEFFPFAGTSAFAASRPDLWRRDREGRNAFAASRDILLSPAFAETRAFHRDFLTRVARDFQVDGIQLEFVSEPLDPGGCVVYGYETPIVAAFIQANGTDPRDLPNSDPAWLQFRADYWTRLIRELWAGLRTLDREITLSVSLTAGPWETYWKRLLDWPAWVAQGLVDTLCLWHRQANLDNLRRWTAEAAAHIDGRCHLVAELYCYSADAFQSPAALRMAGLVSREAGAAALGIYRADAVEVYGLWDVLAELAALEV
ncbi:MAG: family 10 glycosylhydrolase [Chloroflexi bacterium]|nr:family 10 glycosylhydrolase [Chloroflexota bacterium]